MASLPNTNQTEPNSPVPPLTIPKKLMAIFSYLSILFWIPIFICKDNPTIKFHIRQGLVLFLAEIVTGLAAFFDFQVWLGIVICLFMLIWLAFSLVGFKNIIKGGEASLPIVGKIASKISFPFMRI